jgi:hypothetical protein
MIKNIQLEYSANSKYKPSKPIAMLTLVNNALTRLKDCMHFEDWVVFHLTNFLAMSCITGRQAMRFISLIRWQIHMIEKNWASTRTFPP